MIRKLPALALCAALAVPSASWAQAAGQQAEEQRNAAQQPGETATFEAPNSFHQLAAAKLPAVVSVVSTQEMADVADERRGPGFPPGLEEFFRRFGEELPERFGRPMPPLPERALGSGFIIDPQGYIVTNNHVVEGGGEIQVILADDGPKLAAEVVGRDPRTDLALLKVEPEEPLPTLQWGDSEDALVGDWVMAIGNPFGLGSTVTTGVVSARARDLQAGPYDDFIQTDAAINRGNSGGPLIDMEGRVVGVNTAIFSPTGGSIGIGFAVPSSIAQPVIQQLRETGTVRRGWLGVQIQPVTDEISQALNLEEAQGALVSAVTEGAPAAEAGIQIGDVILNFAGTEIEDLRDLTRAVADAPIGQEAQVVVWRDGERMTLTPKIALLEEEPEEEVAVAEPTEETGLLGLALAPLTPERRARFDIEDDVKGVLVTDVDEGSVAFQQGLEPGDVIVRVGQQEVSNPQEVTEAIEQAQAANRDAVLVLRQRDEVQTFVALPIEQQQRQQQGERKG